MKVDGKSTRSIWVESDGASLGIIDQTLLPHRFVVARLKTLADAAHAIRSMQVRGAPEEARPPLRNRPRGERVAAAMRRANEIAEEDIAINQAIGRHGLKIIE